MMQSAALRRRGGWAALFALSLQIVLAFGHMHPLPVASAPVLSAASGGPLHSGGGDPSGAAQDICAICVAVNLASAVTLPPPVPLAVPVRTYEVVSFSGSQFVLPRLHAFPFQTRAPPAA